MATKTSLILTISDSGNSNSGTKSIQYISNEATNDELLNFADAFMALSTKNLLKVSKVTKTDIERE